MFSFGFSTRHWQQIEAGRPISMRTLFRICDVFGVKPEHLLRGLYSPFQRAPEDAAIEKDHVHRRKQVAVQSGAQVPGSKGWHKPD